MQPLRKLSISRIAVKRIGDKILVYRNGKYQSITDEELHKNFELAHVGGIDHDLMAKGYETMSEWLPSNTEIWI